MPSVARVGDPTAVATCPPDHDDSAKDIQVWVGSAVISSGSGNVFVNGISTARLGDSISLGDPKHPTGVIVAGSGNVFANGIAVSRVGDTTINGAGWVAPISAGSGNVFANG